jgi:predicted transposase YdaD
LFAQNLNKDKRALAMNLTPVYEQWRKETLQEGRQEGRQEGIQLGLQQGERSLILRQLSRGVGTMSPDVMSQVEALPLQHLEALGEALLDFTNADDLMTWLRTLGVSMMDYRILNKLRI